MKTLVKAINVLSAPDDVYEEKGIVSYPRLERVLKYFLSDHWLIQHYSQLQDDKWHIIFTKEVDDDAIDNGNELVKKSLDIKSASKGRPSVFARKYYIGTVIFFIEGPYKNKQGIIVRKDEFNTCIYVALNDEGSHEFDIVSFQADDPSFILVDVDLEDEGVCQIGDIVNTIDDINGCVVVDVNAAEKMVKLYVDRIFDREIFIERRFDQIVPVEDYGFFEEEEEESTLIPYDLVSFEVPDTDQIRYGLLFERDNDIGWVGLTTQEQYIIMNCSLNDFTLEVSSEEPDDTVEYFRLLKKINQYALTEDHPYQKGDIFYVVEGRYAGEEGSLAAWNHKEVILYMRSLPEPTLMNFKHSQVVKWINYYEILHDEF